MNFLSPRTHPLPLLLYIEWSLLLSVFCTEAFRVSILVIPALPMVNWLCFLVFALLGFFLPQGPIKTKIVYTIIEFSLVLVVSIWGLISLFPLLYIIIATRNCLILQGKWRLVVMSVTYGLFLISQSHRFSIITQRLDFSQAAPAQRLLIPETMVFVHITTSLVFGLLLLFTHVSISAILAERKSRENLAIINQKLRNYALKAEDIATLKERNRVAREIHDSLGHSLVAFNLHIEAALRLQQSDPQEAQILLEEAKQLVNTALADVRQSVSILRSDPVGEKSLATLVQLLLKDFQRSTGIEPYTNIEITTEISKEKKTVVYRILQEALTNICKYAEATEVRVQIMVHSQVKLVIQDNGIGFVLEENTTGFGLQGIYERVNSLGGNVVIITSPGLGCKIIVDFER